MLTDTMTGSRSTLWRLVRFCVYAAALLLLEQVLPLSKVKFNFTTELVQGAPLNEPDHCGDPPLLLAAGNGALSCLALCMTRADVIIDLKYYYVMILYGINACNYPDNAQVTQHAATCSWRKELTLNSEMWYVTFT